MLATRPAIPALAIVLLLGVPAATTAQDVDRTVRVSLSSKGTMLVRGGDAADRLTITQGSGGLRLAVAGSGARVAPGGGCRGTTARGAACTRPGVRAERLTILTGAGNDTVSIRSDLPLNLQLGAGNDRVLVRAIGASVRPLVKSFIRGGDGNDVLVGGDANELLFGEGGDDDIDGKGGSDTADGGPGDDLFLAGERAAGASGERFVGGEGRDTVNYRFVATGVTVTLDGVANDGRTGDQRDDVEADVERLIGGDGNDVLTGNDQDNSIFGGLGDDRSYGLGGNDNIYENTGKDLLDGGAGQDQLRAEEAEGADGAPDTFTCGADVDHVVRSADDTVDASCENVQTK